jgi:hypothetical protein
LSCPNITTASDLQTLVEYAFGLRVDGAAAPPPPPPFSVWEEKAHVRVMANETNGTISSTNITLEITLWATIGGMCWRELCWRELAHTCPPPLASCPPLQSCPPPLPLCPPPCHCALSPAIVCPPLLTDAMHAPCARQVCSRAHAKLAYVGALEATSVRSLSGCA